MLWFLVSKDFLGVVRLAVGSKGRRGHAGHEGVEASPRLLWRRVSKHVEDVVLAMPSEEMIPVLHAFATAGVAISLQSTSQGETAMTEAEDEYGEEEGETEELEESVVLCPVCGASVAVTAGECCPHLLCWGGEGWYDFASSGWDFQDALGELYAAAAEALEQAEDRLDPALRADADRMVYHTGTGGWREDPSLMAEEWSTDGMLGGCWEAFFHPDPGEFAREIGQETARRIDQFRAALQNVSP